MKRKVTSSNHIEHSYSIEVIRTLPPTYALPVIVANPSLSSKPTRLISMMSWSPGVTGDFHLYGNGIQYTVKLGGNGLFNVVWCGAV